MDDAARLICLGHIGPEGQRRAYNRLESETPMSLQTNPVRLDLKKDERLEIEWQDGLRSVYPLSMLRALCPCAQCRTIREQDQGKKKPLLRVLPGNYDRPLSVVDAELVGGYAVRLDWSDGHSSGIYSFEYLRQISPQKKSE
jgi:DUF971 family protein